MPEGSAGGRKGTAKARVHTVFNHRVVELQAQARNLYQAFQAAEQRRWQMPVNFTGDLFLISSLHEPAFNRADINTNYEEATRDPDNAGTNGDIISLKLQLDYVAAEERAFRHRHAGLTRNICHAHGRRYGHAEGRMFPAVREEVERFIASGGVSS